MSKSLDLVRFLLRDFWRILRGRPYYRFAALLVSAGAGLLAGPEFWEVVLGAVAWLLAIVYQAEYTRPDFATQSLVAQISGGVLVALGVAVFVGFYRSEKSDIDDAAIVSEWQELRRMWRGLYDLAVPPASYNPVDVAIALNAVNESASVLRLHRVLVGRFADSYGQDYKNLYSKLARYDYRLPNYKRPSGELLSPEAHRLVEHLESYDERKGK